MKNITKKLLIFALSLIICFTGTPVFAETLTEPEELSVTPRWSHLGDVTFSFAATSSGGYVDVLYNGYEDSFVKADLNVKIQKRFLLVFWTDVGEWNTSSTDVNGILSHVFSLSGSGTYKATFTLTITGTDGTVDTLTDSRESSY